MIIQGLICLLAVGYPALIIAYYLAWKKLPRQRLPPDYQPTFRITILIPARNEAANILACLQGIADNIYPAHLLELIVLDDHSDDNTALVTAEWMERKRKDNSWKVRSTPSDKTGKKAAITHGIALATGDIIACTDADCIPPPQWLIRIAWEMERKETMLVTGPVVFHQEKSILDWFQSLDLLGMMGITAAGIQSGRQHLANGANMAYRKQAFTELNGFQGNETIASGDDLFLVQKAAAKWPGCVRFIQAPEAIVQTLPMPDWRSFIAQRIRWGGKNAALPEWPVRLSLLLILLHSWAAILTLFLGFFCPAYFYWSILLWGGKMTADYFFLGKMSQFYNKKQAMRYFLPAIVLHLCYIAVIGIMSLLFKNATWKGRPTSS